MSVRDYRGLQPRNDNREATRDILSLRLATLAARRQFVVVGGIFAAFEKFVEIDGEVVLIVFLNFLVENDNLFQGVGKAYDAERRVVLLLLTHEEEAHFRIVEHIRDLRPAACGVDKKGTLRRRPRFFLFGLDDLDNEEIISLVELTPTYKRSKDALADIKAKSYSNVPIEPESIATANNATVAAPGSVISF